MIEAKTTYTKECLTKFYRFQIFRSNPWNLAVFAIPIVVLAFVMMREPVIEFISGYSSWNR